MKRNSSGLNSFEPLTEWESLWPFLWWWWLVMSLSPILFSCASSLAHSSHLFTPNPISSPHCKREGFLSQLCWMSGGDGWKNPNSNCLQSILLTIQSHCPASTSTLAHIVSVVAIPCSGCSRGPGDQYRSGRCTKDTARTHKKGAKTSDKCGEMKIITN